MVSLVRVFVADNHPITCVGIQAILVQTTDLQFVGGTHRLQNLATILAEDSPDVLLIAANLATDSLSATVSTWKQKFACKLLLMLPQTDESSLQKLIRQGADGAFLKTDSPDKLVQAIRTVSQGELWLSQPLWQKIKQLETQPISFSETEKEMLPLIITEMTVEEIAETLHLSRRTVCRQLENICLKLNVTKRLGAAIEIIKRDLA